MEERAMKRKSLKVFLNLRIFLVRVGGQGRWDAIDFLRLILIRLVRFPLKRHCFWRRNVSRLIIRCCMWLYTVHALPSVVVLNARVSIKSVLAWVCTILWRCAHRKWLPHTFSGSRIASLRRNQFLIGVHRGIHKINDVYHFFLRLAALQCAVLTVACTSGIHFIAVIIDTILWWWKLRKRTRRRCRNVFKHLIAAARLMWMRQCYHWWNLVHNVVQHTPRWVRHFAIDLLRLLLMMVLWQCVRWVIGSGLLLLFAMWPNLFSLTAVCATW